MYHVLHYYCWQWYNRELCSNFLIWWHFMASLPKFKQLRERQQPIKAPSSRGQSVFGCQPYKCIGSAPTSLFQEPERLPIKEPRCYVWNGKKSDGSPRQPWATESRASLKAMKCTVSGSWELNKQVLFHQTLLLKPVTYCLVNWKSSGLTGFLSQVMGTAGHHV